MAKTSRDFWRWPEKPHTEDTVPVSEKNPRGLVKISQQLKDLKAKDPYDTTKPRLPMCFPGTQLGKEQMGRVRTIMAAQRNHIGSHTRGHAAEPGFVDDTGALEARAIWMLAGTMGGAPETADGYFCGGATEANDMGMWIGREWINSHPDPHNMGIVVLCTPLTHYSINKACHKLGIAQKSRWLKCHQCGNTHVFVPDSQGRGLTYVGMNEKGEMDVEDLERKFRMRHAEGFRRFIVVANVGTTSLGSIDPVEEIGRKISHLRRENPSAYFYLHVDAAFGGFTVPFVNPDRKFGFDVPEVMSVSVDGDKMGQLPYPGGVFLCRKDLQELISLQVTYVGGHEDDTFCGSRTSVAPLLAWYQFQTFGMEGQRAYVQGCLDVRYHLINKMKEKLSGVFRPLPYSSEINILPMEMAMDERLGRIPLPTDYPEGTTAHQAATEIAEKLEPYLLRGDHLPRDPADPDSCPRIVYKLCIMPHHTKEHMDAFVADLAEADAIWAKHMVQD